jgi:CofH subfamily radical SAM domain protein
MRLALRERPQNHSPVMYQKWRELLFLHWAYDPLIIQDTLPPGLSVDTFAGKAYVGLVPFFMRDIRPRFVPVVPGISNFLEVNLRTYVHDERGVAGVWFYSLDANQWLAVQLARSYIRAIREAHPDVQIKAFTAAEIDYFAKRWKIPAEEILDRLIAAGLNSMPGGGAEIFSNRVAKELRYAGKAQAERWLEIHGMAHTRGIPSNATMLYGHIETYAERVEHLRLLREQQDRSGGFLAFIPLEYQISEEKIVARHASALDDLKTIAVSRLMLDNFPHVKAYWIMLQEDTAGIALNFGADDIDGTIAKERIAHAADARSPAGLTRKALIRLIRDAGKTPVERDALYNEINVYTDADIAAVVDDVYRPVQRSRESPRAGRPLPRNVRT